MKATGIVRRIDELGRIVIPKEIRRTLHIREGDPLEIYTEKNGEVIFKKYSPMGDLTEFAGQICEAIGKNTGRIAAIADRDSIIAVCGAPRRELLEKRTSAQLQQLMTDRKHVLRQAEGQPVAVVEGSAYTIGVAEPILAEGDLMGSVLLLAPEEGAQFDETDQKLASTVAAFLGRQLES